MVCLKTVFQSYDYVYYCQNKTLTFQYTSLSTNVILPEYDVRQLSPSALLKISESFEIIWLGKAGWVAIFFLYINFSLSLKITVYNVNLTKI